MIFFVPDLQKKKQHREVKCISECFIDDKQQDG